MTEFFAEYNKPLPDQRGRKMSETGTSLIVDNEYVDLLNDLKTQIKTAQIKAHRAVNTELIKLYWTIGKELLARQKVEAWGSKYLEQVSRDLQIEFPGMKGFSKRNLERMRQFASMYPGNEITPQAVSHLPWGHIVLLMHKLKQLDTQKKYAQQLIEQGWSRNILTSSKLHAHIQTR